MREAEARVTAEVAATHALAEKTRRERRVGDVTVLAAWCAGFPSEIGDKWGKATPNAVVALYDTKSDGVSFRRSPTSTVDLSRVAETFGGGGHAAAAGCKIPGMGEPRCRRARDARRGGGRARDAGVRAHRDRSTTSAGSVSATASSRSSRRCSRNGDFAPVRGGGRRSEVAMAIRRPSGGILLQTKAFYPAGTYRLPTGGIKDGEDVEHALLREVHEESNLDVEIERLVAVIDHSVARRQGALPLLHVLAPRDRRHAQGERSRRADQRLGRARRRGARARGARPPQPRRDVAAVGQFRAVALEVLAGAVR